MIFKIVVFKIVAYCLKLIFDSLDIIIKISPVLVDSKVNKILTLRIYDKLYYNSLSY